jgi:histidine ammonia-lyase
MTIKIGEGKLTLEDIANFIYDDEKIAISAKCRANLNRVRKYVERKLESDIPYYGINTGFGLLADKRIPDDQLELLQENLIISHAVGVGDPFPIPVAKLIMLLRATVLSFGYSGIRAETLDLLVEMINRDIVPVIPQQGSVGASGDLAPLSHLALALIGRGEVFYKGDVVPSKRALKKEGLVPIRLAAKEGIALINGTQAMTAMGAIAMIRLENLLRVADIVGALSLEGDRASRKPFDTRIQKLRPHPGQAATAANIRKLIKGSGIINSHANCKRVQDPYSFRCIPQVHGAVKDQIAYARATIERELVSCTDNPLIFADDDAILSGGNFHGEPLALAMDAVAVAVSELGSIAERRVAILTKPLQGEVPTKFLIKNPGLNSGLMIAHVTMSSLASENKALSHPASVDSIPTSGGQEDHVSMGTTAARKAMQVIKNVEMIVAIELFAACQAIEFQIRHGAPGAGTSAAYNLVREHVPPLEGDREYRHDIEKCIGLVCSGDLVRAVEGVCGDLKV